MIRLKFETWIEILLALLILGGLYAASLYGYLLFHILAEGVGIIVAGTFFLIVWNSRRFLKNSYLLFLGIGYFFIAGLYLMHTLAYKGMNIFPGYGANLPTQLWIAARYIESLTLLAAPFFLYRALNVRAAFAGYAILFTLLLTAIFSGLFPVCFIEGKGLTAFKINSEYLTALLLLGAFFLLLRCRFAFDALILRLMLISITFSIGAGLAFTFYVKVYGLSNLFGHYFNLLSFYCIYKAIIETGLKKPYILLFRELKQNEEALQQARQTAEQAKEEADAANHAKSAFLAKMSHELRTPLNAILGYAQILQQNKVLDAECLHKTGIIYSSGEHLLTLINDILDLSKIEASKMELLPADIHIPSFLEGIAGIVRARAEKKSLDFSVKAYELPQGMRADEVRLRQILLNLLSNAIKFTKKGGVTLSVKSENVKVKSGETESTLCQAHDAVFHFEIEDTGAGIPPDEQEHIFLPFEQAGDTRERAEGTGLGLSITQHLVGLMGGELHVNSTPGQGSAFWFEVSFPVIAMEAKEQQQPAREIIGYSGARRKILVADDKLDNRMVLFDMLKLVGCEVVLAENGQEAAAKALDVRPDLILIDLVMPVMTGFEAVQMIRREPALRDVPIIAVSASVLESDQRKSLVVGCDAFLPKPVQAATLYALLETHLNLTWRHAEPAADTLAQQAPLLSPPPEELAVLHEMALAGVMSDIEERAAHIVSLGEQYRPFAETLRRLAQGFAEQEILALVEDCMQKGG
ncbi:MAG: response regulator [Gammaproteobacteria bacterium]|nr:response regulator [Gammaproteobacteria bacterium]